MDLSIPLHVTNESGAVRLLLLDRVVDRLHAELPRNEMGKVLRHLLADG
jgi:hypothetical protein